MDQRVWQAVAGGCTVAALAVPWASAGQVSIRVTSLPWWPLYVGLAAVMHVIAVRRPPAVVAGLTACFATAAAATFVFVGYPDVHPLSDSGVSSLMPTRPGLGWVLALVAVLVSAWPSARARRRRRRNGDTAPGGGAR